MNSDKIEFMYFNKGGAIFPLNDEPLKFEIQFSYFGSKISSTVSDVNLHMCKNWNVIDWLLRKWKSDLSDKTQRGFFQAVAMSRLLYDCTTNLNKTLGEKARQKKHKAVVCCFERILEAASYKTVAVRPLISHLSS